MARLARYRDIVKDVLEEYRQYQSTIGEVTKYIVADREQDHYLLYSVGWRGESRIYGCSIHIDIIDGKIWLQHNGTEIDLAQKLEARGVPKEHIVLGMHSPFKRQYTEYAVE